MSCLASATAATRRLAATIGLRAVRSLRGAGCLHWFRPAAARGLWSGLAATTASCRLLWCRSTTTSAVGCYSLSDILWIIRRCAHSFAIKQERPLVRLTLSHTEMLRETSHLLKYSSRVAINRSFLACRASEGRQMITALTTHLSRSACANQKRRHEGSLQSFLCTSQPARSSREFLPGHPAAHRSINAEATV